MPRPFLSAVLVALGLGVVTTVVAADAGVTLRAGAAREDITPDPSVLNWITGKPYGRVIDPLLLQALVLDDGRSKAVLIRWDLVDVSESARDEVRQAVGAALQVPADNILVHASHNHSAPWAPTYREGYRGRERDTWWSIRFMPVQDEHAPYAAWKQRLITAAVAAAQRAAKTAQPVTLSVGRISVAEFLYNRRRRPAAWGLADPNEKSILTNGRGEWVPEVLLAGATFGPLDRTLSLVFFRDSADRTVASLYHLSLHPVAIYPEDANRISADWPGAATREITALLGGESLFLQGCGGDITPSWPRGVEATAVAAKALAKRAETAARFRSRQVPGKLVTARTTVQLPLTAEARERLGAASVAAEVQVIVCGPLAFVALPGEPMTDLNLQIRARSPFPQTLVLGYSNGNGVHYVGMPGEKAHGGYEAGRAGAGAEECGPLLIAAAETLLRDAAERAGVPRQFIR